VKSIFLVPALCVLFISGCSSSNDAAAGGSQEGRHAAKAADAARAAQMTAEALLRQANTDLAMARTMQITPTTNRIAGIQADSVKICLLQIQQGPTSMRH